LTTVTEIEPSLSYEDKEVFDYPERARSYTLEDYGYKILGM
jgi:hypothetical protein